MQFSWEWNFTGRAGAWFFTILALFVAFICGLAMPRLITPSPSPDSQTVSAEVIRFDTEDTLFHPVFRYQLAPDSSQEFRSPIGSNRPFYAVGDQVLLNIDPDDPASIFIENDRDLAMMILIMRVLAGIFLFLGITILLMLVRGMDSRIINRVGGLLGALTFGIPAAFVLPGLLIAHAMRPNLLFRAQDPFDSEFWIIGLTFSILGVLVTIGTVLVYRYQARTNSDGWHWSYHEAGKTIDSEKTVTGSLDELDKP